MTGAVRAAFCAVLLVSGVANSATTAQLDDARNRGLSWLFSNVSGTGMWTSPGGLPIQTTSAALDVLKKSGIQHGFLYSQTVAALLNAEALSNDALARQVAALSLTGSNTQALTDKLIASRANSSQTWGAYPDYQGSFPDTALALDAILVTNTAYADTGNGLWFIASTQHVDGGWSYSVVAPGTGIASMLIPTSYNVVTLSRYKSVGWSYDSYITKAVNWLVARQKSDGGFAEDSSATTGSAFETALVYTAIRTAQQYNNAAANAAQPALDAAQNFLIANQSGDGSWGGDALQTSLALQTLPTTTLPDTDLDGIPDGVELLLGTNPNVADGRSLVKGNGQSIPGQTAPFTLATATLGQSLTISLPNTGGTGPSTWAIVSGAAPPGLTLNTATGTLSGMASGQGTYNFTYQVTDSSGKVTTASAQIIMISPPANQAPILIEDKGITAGVYPVLIDVLKNDKDPDGNPISLISVTNGAHGTVRRVGSLVEYTAAAGFSGVDSAYYTASDGLGGTSTGVVTVIVYAGNGDEDADGTTNYDELVVGRNMFFNEIPGIMAPIISILLGD